MSRRVRVMAGLVMAPAAVAIVLFLPTAWLAAVAAVLFGLGLWEWSRLSGLDEAPARLGYVTANVLLMAALAWAAGPGLFGLKLAIFVGGVWWLLATLWLARFDFASQDTAATRSLKLLTGSLAAIPAWAALILLHAQTPHGPRWALFALALVWAADTGAFFVGSKFGRHKMSPRISPNKSWEGLVGGLIGAVLLAAACHSLLNVDMPNLPALALLTAVAALLSVVGDLFESLLKRHSGHKDSGTLIPGHGGVLDRLDSLLAALPIFMIGKLWLGL